MKRQIVLIVSLVSGLLAALLTSVYLSSKQSEFAAKERDLKRKYGEMEALAFVRDITSGSVITREDIKTCKTFRMGNEGYVITKDYISDIVGRRTVGYVKKDIALRWTDIEGAERRTGLAADVKPHFRAISINVNGSASVSGMVRSGDYVDVIGTFNFPDDGGRIKRGDPVTCTILQKVLVLAVGDETSKSRARNFGVSSASQYSTVTLQVTPREAEMLAFAEQIKGRLVLTLRNKNDTETEEELPTVEFSKIREQIEDLNRERNPTDLRRKKKLQRGS